MDSAEPTLEPSPLTYSDVSRSPNPIGATTRTLTSYLAACVNESQSPSRSPLDRASCWQMSPRHRLM